jgi:predicted lipoprotein
MSLLKYDVWPCHNYLLLNLYVSLIFVTYTVVNMRLCTWTLVPTEPEYVYPTVTFSPMHFTLWIWKSNRFGAHQNYFARFSCSKSASEVRIDPESSY